MSKYIISLIGLIALLILILIGLKYPIPSSMIIRLHPFGPMFLLGTLFFLPLLLIVSQRFKRPLFFLKKYSFVVPWQNCLIYLVAAGLGILPIFIYWGGAGVVDINWSANYFSIGGYVPWSDAADFLIFANNLIFNGELCEGCNKRPLNSVFLAAKLLITNFNYRYAMLLQGALLGIACLISAKSIVHTHGMAAGIVMFSILYSYGSYFLPTNMSESLGLTLGAVAFAAIWTGYTRNLFYVYVSGVWLFCLAQIARPGTMLVICSLLLIGALNFKDKPVYLKICVLLLLAIIPGFLLEKLILVIYASPLSPSVVSTFSYTIYSISVDGTGWTQIFKDYPGISSMSPSEIQDFMLKKTLLNIRDQPLMFINGLWHGFKFGIENFPLNLLNFILGGIQKNSFYLLLLLPFFVLFLHYSNREHIKDYLKNLRSITNFYTIILSGFILSLTFIYQVGGDRVLASSLPFLASLLAILFYPREVYVFNAPTQKVINKTQNLFDIQFSLPIVFGLLIVFSALLGPVLAHKAIIPPSKVNFECGAGEEQKVLASSAAAFIELKKYNPYIKVHESIENRDWEKILLPATIFLAYDVGSKESMFGYGPTGLFSNKNPYITVCAVRFSNGIWRVKPSSE